MIKILQNIDVAGNLIILSDTGYLDLSKQEIKQAVIHIRTSEPSSPQVGQVITNTLKSDPVNGDGKFGYRTTTKWVYPDMQKSVYDTNNNGSVDNSDKLNGQTASYYLNRSNHTGSQTASSISDFAEAAQDGVGAILTDTNTVDFTYDDPGNQITADVKLDANSALTSSSSGLAVKVDGTTIGLNASKQLTLKAGSGVRKVSGTIVGNGVDSVFNIIHGLNTRFVVVEVYDNNNYATVIVQVERTTVDVIKLTFKKALVDGFVYNYVVMG